MIQFGFARVVSGKIQRRVMDCEATHGAYDKSAGLFLIGGYHEGVSIHSITVAKTIKASSRPGFLTMTVRT